MSFRPDTSTTIDLEEKAISEQEDCWTVTGHAAVFGNVDLGGDVIVPGAFRKSLNDHGLPLILFQHKMDEAPVGVCVDAKEDKRGLWIKAELPKDDEFVRGRLIPQLKRRALKGMSIGYKATDTERRKSDGARLLKEIRLYEASFVSLPMNPQASVDTIKGIQPWTDLPINFDAKSFDPKAALERIQSRFWSNGGRHEEWKRAFLYLDEEKADAGEIDTRFLIADVDENGDLVANQMALYKAVAAVSGARSGAALPEAAEAAIKGHLDRYYSRMSLASPWSSLSLEEYKALDLGEREARLRALGLSQRLAKTLLGVDKSGQRDADRSAGERDVRPSVERDARSTDEQKMLDAVQALLAAVSSAATKKAS